MIVGCLISCEYYYSYTLERNKFATKQSEYMLKVDDDITSVTVHDWWNIRQFPCMIASDYQYKRCNSRGIKNGLFQWAIKDQWIIIMS